MNGEPGKVRRNGGPRLRRWQDLAPPLAVLGGVAVFWAAGLSGLLRVLRDPGSPVSTLVWLYLMLAAVALTVVCAGAAVINLRRRMALSC
jgi:hypothetical protein